MSNLNDPLDLLVKEKFSGMSDDALKKFICESGLMVACEVDKSDRKELLKIIKVNNLYLKIQSANFQDHKIMHSPSGIELYSKH